MMMTLKIQLIILAAIAISLGLGLLLGSAWTERKYRGPIKSKKKASDPDVKLEKITHGDSRDF